jgi:hypothetical protein
MLQQLSTVTLHFPAFLPEFSSSLQHHDIEVEGIMRDVKVKSLSQA